MPLKLHKRNNVQRPEKRIRSPVGTFFANKDELRIGLIPGGFPMLSKDAKPSDARTQRAELNSGGEDTYKSLELAQDLIRALDAQSAAHMERISASEKDERTTETSE
jgi:hypothetical protein